MIKMESWASQALDNSIWDLGEATGTKPVQNFFLRFNIAGTFTISKNFIQMRTNMTLLRRGPWEEMVTVHAKAIL